MVRPRIQAHAEDTAKEVQELNALVSKLRAEAMSREREVAGRDKRIVQMHASTVRLESNKRILELRIKELEETHEPMMAQARVADPSARMPPAVPARSARRSAARMPLAVPLFVGPVQSHFASWSIGSYTT